MNTATVAVEQKEETMKVLSIAELLCLTRSELLELAWSLEVQVKELPHGTNEFDDSLRTLFNVRMALEQIDGLTRVPAPS
jgi:hypothetical protein